MFFFLQILEERGVEFPQSNKKPSIDSLDNEYFVWGESAYGEGASFDFIPNTIAENNEESEEINEDDFAKTKSLASENLRENSDVKNATIKIIVPLRYKLLKMSELLFSEKTQKETFETAMADWNFEIFEAIKKDRDVNLLMINVRHIYGFLAAMWQKSLVGDLIEFVGRSTK